MFSIASTASAAVAGVWRLVKSASSASNTADSAWSSIGCLVPVTVPIPTADIKVMFDKWASDRRFAAASIPCPATSLAAQKPARVPQPPIGIRHARIGPSVPQTPLRVIGLRRSASTAGRTAGNS